MVKKVVTKEDFDALLEWFDANREVAAQKYERIRQRLIRIFAGRGCFEAEELTDETINRVTLKLPQLINDYAGEPALYFYGVANHIYQEWLRKQKKVKAIQISDVEKDDPDLETKFECLEKCLQTLSVAHHRLIIEYYQNEKKARIDHRRELAEQVGISLNALQIKTFRIRGVLQECVERCVNEKKL